MEIWMERTLSGLKAADDASVDALRRVKLGRVVRVELTTPRNVKHHRKFFALLNLVWSSAGDWPSLEHLLDELKKRMGLYEDCGEIIDRETGQILKAIKLKSISFAKMDQTEFDEFYDRALRELCAMAGGIDHAALRAEVLNQLAAA
jgi:hypothetical protein